MKDSLSIVYPGIKESRSPGVRSVLISIPFEHLNYAHTLHVSNALYEGARVSSKQALVPSGIGEAWLPGYYRAFIFDKAQIQQKFPILRNYTLHL